MVSKFNHQIDRFLSGTSEQIKLCRQLIQEKVDAGPGGIAPSLQSSTLRGPPPTAFGPPPQVVGLFVFSID